MSRPKPDNSLPDPPLPVGMRRGKWEWRVSSADNRSRYQLPTRAVAHESAKDLNDNAITNLSRAPYPIAHQQYPWRVEKRAVGEWEGDEE